MSETTNEFETHQNLGICMDIDFSLIVIFTNAISYKFKGIPEKSYISINSGDIKYQCLQ